MRSSEDEGSTLRKMQLVAAELLEISAQRIRVLGSL